MFQDESMIRDDHALTRVGFPKRQKKIVPTFGKHWGAKLLGTLGYVTGEVFCLLNYHYDAQVFLEFLEHTIARYPGEKVVMILDNDKILNSKVIQPFLAEHLRLDLSL